MKRNLKSNLKINKREVKVRRRWTIDPTSRIFKSKKDYNRTKDKINLKKGLGDA